MRKTIAVLLIAALALVIPVSSSAMSRKKRKRIMNSWLQQTKQKLILQEGPPSQVVSDGGSGEIVIYSREVYIPSYNMGSGIYSQAHDLYDNSMFYVNAEGIIYSWRFTTTEKPPQRIDLNIQADVYHH